MASRGNNSRGMGSRQVSNNSLGAISEDGLFGTGHFGFDDDEEQDNQRRDLFEHELSVVDNITSPTTPSGGSVFIDLEAEERAFVSGSQQYLDAMETIKQLKQRLIRRTSIIDEIRKYYLRDVVTVKHILKDVLTTGERRQVLKMYDENLPSIDLKQALALHAPTKCEMQVSQCGECGGQLEIIMKDSDEVDMLKKTIVDCKDRESRFRIKLATLDAQIENTNRERAEANKSHNEEKKFLYAEMKKVKTEGEKIQKSLENINKANKRIQAENATLQGRLNTLSTASQQLEQGSQEIALLRTELDDLTIALKSAKHNEKVAIKELHDHHLELKAEKLKTEEQMETIKTLLLEKDHQHAEYLALNEHLKESQTKEHLTSDHLREAQERLFDMVNENQALKVEHDKLVEIVNATDDGGMRKDLLAAEETCHDLREENRRLRRDNDRFKRQLDKAHEVRQVLEHDLAVAIHEQKEREAELHSITDYLHAKVSKDSSVNDLSEGLKMDDLIHSIKLSARSKVGDAPLPSARVMSAKQQRSEEDGPLSSRPVSRGSLRGSGEFEPLLETDGNDDDIGFENEHEGEHDEGEGEDGEKRGRKMKKGDGKSRKPKNTVNTATAAAGAGAGGSVSPPKRARRPSMDNIKFTVNPTPAVKPALKKATTAKVVKKGPAKKRRGSFTGLEVEMEHHEVEESTAEVEQEVHHETEDGERSDNEEHDEGAEHQRAYIVGLEELLQERGVEIPEVLHELKKQLEKSNEHAEERNAAAKIAAKFNKKPKAKAPVEGIAVPSKAKKAGTAKGKVRRASFSSDTDLGSPSTSRPPTKGDARAGTRGKTTTRAGKSTKSGEEEQHDESEEHEHFSDEEAEGSEEEHDDDTTHEGEDKPKKIRKSPTKKSSLKVKSKASDSGAEEGRAGSREGGGRVRRGSFSAEQRPTSRDIKDKAQGGAVRKAQQAKMKTVSVTLDAKAEKVNKQLPKAMVKKVRRVKSKAEGDIDTGVSAAEEETEAEGEAAEEGGEEEEQTEGLENVNEGDEQTEGKAKEEEAQYDTAEEQVDETDTNDADVEEQEQEQDTNEEDNLSDEDDLVMTPPPKSLAREPSRAKLQKQDSIRSTGSGKKSVPSGAESRGDTPSPVPVPTRKSSMAPMSPSHLPLPLPKRRRSIPKSFSFMRQSMSLDGPSRHGSMESMTGISAALAAVNGLMPNTNASSVVSAESIREERLEELHEEFAMGVHRVAEPRSIVDEPADDCKGVKFVPIIPIEVRRYIEDKEKDKKKKFVPPTEEIVALEPLGADATPFETALRAELYKNMKLFPTAKESEVNKMLNASKDAVHRFCNMFASTLESNWASLHATRAALDLHYVVKNVVEGMGSTCEPKAGAVELADACKKILPIAASALSGPGVSLKWQEEVKLNETLLSALLPVVDGATGKLSTRGMSDFFNTKMLDPTSKVRGANNLVLEKVTCATEAAAQMAAYAEKSSAAVSDKLTVVLKDWAKVKTAYYDMDNKIAQEKDKVRKILETRINDLTKEKTNLGVQCKQHETRIAALEHVESELTTAQNIIKKNLSDLQTKQELITEGEGQITELNIEIDALRRQNSEKGDQIVSLEGQIASLQQHERDMKLAAQEKEKAIVQIKGEFTEVSESRDHFQAQYERMVSMEDSRLNKLVSVHMQVEPMVQDLAIQTEFVAPPMNLRTMVASKNAKGKKVPLIFSQSLEVPPSDAGALTSTMVDSASSTYNPLSSHIGAVISARTIHSQGSGFPLLLTSDLVQQSMNANSFYQANNLSARSTRSVESALSSPVIRHGHGHPLSREDSRQGELRQSRGESFYMNASDFLAAAPINYELSNRNLMPADSITEISRMLAPDEGSVSSARSHHTNHHTGKIHRKKVGKLARLSADPHAGSSGHYHHVHMEDKIPEWGSIHAAGPVKSANIDPRVVLGVSGVSNLVGQTKPSLQGSRDNAFAHHNAASGGVSNLSAAGSSVLRTSVSKSPTRGLEIEVGLPEVKVQSYHIPTSQNFTASMGRSNTLQRMNSELHLRSNPNSRGSMGGSFGLGSTSPSEKEYLQQSEHMHLMLDSPSLGGHSGYPNYDFEKDRKDPNRVAGDLPPGQESVGGIIYNHRHPNTEQYRSEDPYAQDVPDLTHNRAGPSKKHNSGESGMMQSASVASGVSSVNNKGMRGPKGSGSVVAAGSGHNAVAGVSEDVLKRLRKELLSR